MDAAKLLLACVGVIALGAVVSILWGIVTYNGLVSKEESVKTQWAQVESVYQRRFDLIPNLVATVKGYATHEKMIWDEFAQARQQFSTASNVESKVAATNQLEGLLTKLSFVVEQYPELKANENFLELQAQLEGTENRINVERERYNDQVKIYATSKRTFPTVVIAGMFGFKDYEYFESKAGAENAPMVEFP